MFKTETHLHTRPVSFCAYFSPEEMIRFYKEAGYHTVFVSDHFAANHFARLGELSWQEKTALLYGSYLRAKAEGEKLGMNVLFSPELTLCGNHYLLYHADLEFLNSREDFFSLTMEEFYRHAKAHGIFIVQAHPYRDGKCKPTPEYVDGFEIINTNPRHENHDELSIPLIHQYRLPFSAGSDAHREEDIARVAMLSQEEIKTTEQYIALLRSGQAQILVDGKIFGEENA
jgi:histidinol phosphatase-like PHP family hydrolase